MIKSYIHMLVVYVHLLPNNLKLLYPSALSSPSPSPYPLVNTCPPVIMKSGSFHPPGPAI